MGIGFVPLVCDEDLRLHCLEHLVLVYCVAGRRADGTSTWRALPTLPNAVLEATAIEALLQALSAGSCVLTATCESDSACALGVLVGEPCTAAGAARINKAQPEARWRHMHNGLPGAHVPVDIGRPPT